MVLQHRLRIDPTAQVSANNGASRSTSKACEGPDSPGADKRVCNAHMVRQHPDAYETFNTRKRTVNQPQPEKEKISLGGADVSGDVLAFEVAVRRVSACHIG